EKPPKHESAPVPAEPKAGPPKPQPQASTARSKGPPAGETLVEPTHDGGVAAGPAVRRFAREVGVDLSRVSGSGTSGRITREDVLAVVRQASQTAASVAKATTATARDAWGPIRPE